MEGGGFVGSHYTQVDLCVCLVSVCRHAELPAATRTQREALPSLYECECVSLSDTRVNSPV